MPEVYPSDMPCLGRTHYVGVSLNDLVQDIRVGLSEGEVDNIKKLQDSTASMKDPCDRKDDDASAMESMNEFLGMVSQYSVGLDVLK
jgi:hypothetical protein